MTETVAAPAPAFSAQRLAEVLALARGGEPQAPTPEQRRVIEAPATPTLVVAGAGSGKTHTMAQRVLWLVANGLATPDEVLGLTFTRKAARELQERLARELAVLVEADIVDPARIIGRQPVVQTYNSFASSLFKEWALLIGRDPESEVLTDAAAFLLALRIARASDDLRLASLGSAASIAERVVQLSGELGDHHVTTERVRRLGVAEAFAGLPALPGRDGRLPSATAAGPLRDDAARVGALAPLLDLVDAFDDAKRRQGVVQFSDQVRFALDAIGAHEGAIAELRSRHRFVLLDEFQDTSVLQLELLGRIFREQPVMAVGDPNQAIYGFRGASAGTLALFPRAFGATERMTLSTSWRNDRGILDLAAEVAQRLPLQEGVPVERLQPRESAGVGEVAVSHHATVDDETAALAAWIRRHGAGTGTGERTAAVLVRTHAHGLEIADGLRAQGIHVTRVGGGGLLEEPAVVDLVAALRVLGRPEEGSSLVRLLAGSRWRVGVADLMALQHAAGRMARAGLTDEQRARDRSAVVPEAASSIVDALDALVDADALEGASAEGLARMQDAARLLRSLRRRAGVPLPELVRIVEQALRLDIEVGAHPGREHAVLDAFAREAHAFAAADPVGTLDAFLRYLEALEQGRGPDAPPPPRQPGVVQVLTMHASKGLEWDVVALPRLAQAQGEKRSRGWLDWARVPYALRGDRDLLARFDWEQPTQQDYLEARGGFIDELAAFDESERDRLAYVAVTRARDALWLSGAQWYGTAPTPATPARLLQLAAEATGTPLLPDAAKADGNPRRGTAAPTVWPADPLGARRAQVERAAQAVLAARADASTPWDDAIDRLLAEQTTTRLALPTRIAASGFKDWAADPVAVAQQIARPMPQRPFAATRLGTLFHSWVEHRGSAIGLGEAVDDTAVEVDADLVGIDAARLERLKTTFLASKYGALEPAETELEIHLPLAGTTVVCKIDAVYRDGDRATVVDWKTGRPPADDAERDARMLQLALYRAAYAAHARLDPHDVDAELYYVEVDRIIRPDRVESLAELEQRWLAAQQAVAVAAGGAPA